MPTTSSDIESAAEAITDLELCEVTEASTSVLRSRICLGDELDDAGKYAICAFGCHVLSLDFLENKAYNRTFVEKTGKLICEYARLRIETQRALIVQLLEGSYADDQLGTVILMVKQDEFFVNNGCQVLIAAWIVMFLSTGCYDSRYRSFLRHCSALLALSWESVQSLEDSVTHLLIDETYVESAECLEVRKRQEKIRKIKRYALIGTAGVIGGGLIGLTGGLAAPLVATGAGVVIGAGAAAGIATTAGAAVLGTVFGIGGAGLAGYKMKKRVGGVEEFVVETLSDGHGLNCAITVSGWIESDLPESFRYPWRHLQVSKEQYTIRYETKYLLELGRAMEYFMSIAVSVGVQQTLYQTALAGLLSAIAWPLALLSISNVIDNPWNVGVNRAVEVGRHLADVLLKRQHGQRPVTLLGFSLGARVIFHALLEMSNRPACHGIIEDVYLLGAPVQGSASDWERVCQVVGGRVVNGYSRTDWLLKFLYRTMSAQITIAGTGPVRPKNCTNIVNYDLSHLVSGHQDYRRNLRQCLEAVGVSVREQREETFDNLRDAVKGMPTNPLTTVADFRILSGDSTDYELDYSGIDCSRVNLPKRASEPNLVRKD